MKKSDFKYGLMVVDGRQDDEMIDIIHFVAYAEKPTKVDADNLMGEFKTDASLGLSDIVEHLVILPATPDVTEYYLKILNSNDDEE